jgi:hypothetical protein
MTHDELVSGALVLAFAALVTAHLTLVIGLAGRPPRWRAAVALVAPPLAPYWGAKEHFRIRSIAWIASAVFYLAMRWAARH